MLVTRRISHVALALLTGIVSCGTPEVTREGSGHAGHGGEGGDSGTGTGRDGGMGIGGALFSAGGAPEITPETDGSTGSPGDTCAAATAEVKPVPLDIALLVDTSYSMDFDLRWQYVKGALTTFVESPEQDDLGLALQFFPLREQCSVSTYAQPAFPMASVSGARASIEQTLNERRMSGGTPLVQVLQGMGDYATQWAKGHDDHKTVIVVATDGVPDATCAATSLNPPNDLPNAAKIAKALVSGSPSLPVFVIGVGDELDALNTIADAGGTGTAVLIRNGADAQKEFLDALRNIRQKSLGCDYLVPDAKAGSIDYKTVNVDFTEGKRLASSFFYVDAADGCDLKPTEGWYYDDPAAPTKVILCPATCDRVAKVQDGRIDIAYGCKQRAVR
ncbi:MAG TPA: vWA domain-containing protein [Polyangiaceae bacterium]